MALVETAVGLVPAGGGCKELLLRMLDGLPNEQMDFRPANGAGRAFRGNDGSTSETRPKSSDDAVHQLTCNPSRTASIRNDPHWRKCRSMRPTQLEIGYLRALGTS